MGNSNQTSITKHVYQPILLFGSLVLSVIALVLILIMLINTAGPVSACDAPEACVIIPPPAATEDPGGGGDTGGGDTGGGDTGGDDTGTGPTDSSGPNFSRSVIMRGDICSVGSVRMAIQGSVLSIYGDFGPHNPNGMLITQIRLQSIRNVTEEEKASGEVIPLLSKDSEYASGWSISLYWKDGHYGVQVNGGSVTTDTGAICGWF